MVGFVGREAELGLLNRLAAGAGSALVPIWGRRRVGKSELILRFLSEHPGLYFVGKTAPAGLQLAEFLREAARLVDEPLLADLPRDDWKRALEEVVRRWQGPHKLVIVLDEFQWLVQASPELPSVLQELWDRTWQRDGKVMLILCGSFVGFMEREVLGKRSPLFGRRSAQIHLMPFGFRDAARFFPRWSNVERARAYFVCGGVPMYAKAFDPERSVEQNIASTLLDGFGVLHSEPDFLLREELREVDNYYAVLLAVAEGLGSQRDIAKRSGLPERSLHYYLNQLVELGYLARRYPVTGSPPAARNVRMRLEDPLLRFWFRFVFPNLSRIQRLAPREAFREVVAPGLEPYFGECFERLCREALPLLYSNEGVDTEFEVGEYWDKQVQIDVVGHRGDGWTDLGECKWGSVRSARAIVDELEEKIARYPHSARRTVARRIFVRDKARTHAENVRWHDLDELYG